MSFWQFLFFCGAKLVACTHIKGDIIHPGATAMNERTFFLAALEIPDPAARAAYLDQACAGNEALRYRLDVLLAEHDKPGSLLANPPQLGAPLEKQTVSEGPGSIIGPYKLMEQIG